MSSSDNLDIVGVFVAPLPIVDVRPVGCCLVYDGTAAGTATSRYWFWLKLEGGKDRTNHCIELDIICYTRTNSWKEQLMECLTEIEANWCQVRCKCLALQSRPLPDYGSNPRVC